MFENLEKADADTSLGVDSADIGAPKEEEWMDDAFPSSSSIVAATSSNGGIYFIDAEIAAKKIADTWVMEDGPGFAETNLQFPTVGNYPMSHFRTILPNSLQSSVIIVTVNVHSVAGIGTRAASFDLDAIYEVTRQEEKDVAGETEEDENKVIENSWLGGRWSLFGKNSFYPGYGFIGLTPGDVSSVELKLTDFNSLFCIEEQFIWDDWLTKDIYLSTNYELRDGAKTVQGEVFSTTYKAIPVLGITLWTEFLVMDALMQQSAESLFSASFEGNMRSHNSVCWPIGVSEENYAEILENLQGGAFLEKNPQFVRLMCSVFPIVSYMSTLAINTLMIDVSILGTTLIGQLALMEGINQWTKQKSGSISYYNDTTDKGTIFNSLAYANTEMMFSSQKVGFVFSTPCSPYYILTKSDYGLFTIYIASDGGSVKSTAEGGNIDALIYEFNHVNPEEYIYSDGWIFAKYAFDYDSYTLEDHVWKSGGEPQIMVSNLYVELVNPEEYSMKEIALYEDLTCELPDLSPMDEEDGKTLQLSSTLNACNSWSGGSRPKNGPWADQPEWAVAGGTPLDCSFAKCDPEKSVKEKFGTGALLGVCAESNSFHRIFYNILINCCGISTNLTTIENEDGTKTSSFPLSLYAMVITSPVVDDDISLTSLADGYQMTYFSGGLTAYPIVKYQPDNNISRYKMIQKVIANENPCVCKIRKVEYEIAYTMGTNTDDLSGEDIGIISITQMPFGAQHKSLALVTYATVNKEGIKNLKVTAITIDAMKMTPNAYSEIMTINCNTAIPQLYHDLNNGFLTLYSQNEIIRIQIYDIEGKEINELKAYNLPGDDHVLISDIQVLSEGISSFIGAEWDIGEDD